MSDQKRVIEYDDQTVRMFMIASIFWGAVGMLVGVIVAAQLNFHFLNFNTEWLTFGRLRPLHTNAVIFAFVGNMMFAGVYHSTQRLVKARLGSDFLSKLHFWGWQLIIVSAAITLPLGLTRGKEYAELIWPINIAVALIWVVFGINFFWTLAKRNEKSLYVAIWFYIATIVTVAMLYIVNHLSIPTSLLHSYPVFGGVQDALVQWWYGHNAVAFFLTTPILGIMYYYMPKAANRPVYSYRLSVVHFWSLVFIYIWAGPHHLLYTALPGWLQQLGMIFSLMLWAPSWGGMLNGLLTLRGAWDKLRTDPVLKFFAAGVTFYGMATFEGPLLSIRSVNALAHYTDWIIGHVHAGTLGWNGFMAAGMFYFLAPRLWNTKLYSVPMANMHFWLGLVGILLYVASMWVSGITQGLMLNNADEQGILAYPNFLETLQSIRPLMLTRVVGGGLYLAGFLLMAYNIWKTMRSGEKVNGVCEVAENPEKGKAMGLGAAIAHPAFLYSAGLVVFSCLWLFGSGGVELVGLVLTVAVTMLCVVHFARSGDSFAAWYDKLLESSFPFTVLVLVAAATGGIIQIVPLVNVDRDSVVEDKLQKVYTPLELAGRDIYVAEGCYNCHSQMIRPFVAEVRRYGEYSRLGESVFDHPYQWGSRRTGPDLARLGGKYPDSWHFDHMLNPRSTSPDSNMPNYPWLFEKYTDYASLSSKIRVQKILGVPFEDLSPAEIDKMAKEQAKEIAENLESQGKEVDPDKQIVALIAYLQQLGDSEDFTPEVAAAK
ncbi:cytochrome-c oxidase, cbb3-type subunit I [Pelagicoccus sp. SDUM812003]|uniref:cytochrome-c oxidase, cbb3-type subunit I n=1 Tax=Pelagicoccus sp. SDUM812003 TaxID=3041267 RepID=UPI00280E7356|nr:cytochrome-c oxidase, cbb3-type subunit I [Pelagicoccus sp. SDUM812003]MDQ8203612.1 cytochrome-c oxidase, cbb3-type subunit I [Pelagicoccus sp. SDUM812003]